MPKLLCPLKLPVSYDGPRIEGISGRDCDEESCAWWNGEVKECFISTVGKFMRSLHADLDSVQLQLQKMQK